MRAVIKLVAVAAAFVTVVNAAVPVYGQCGGINHTGDTDCEAGTYCQ